MEEASDVQVNIFCTSGRNLGDVKPLVVLLMHRCSEDEGFLLVLL